ncbi:MAG: hypothetical protein ACRDRS_20155 [Pseudonocardiaceae bacterium]
MNSLFAVGDDHSHDYDAHFTDTPPAFGFIDPDDLDRELRNIGLDLRTPIRGAVALFVRSRGLPELDCPPGERDRIWWWAVKASRYAAIYLVSRREARANSAYIREHAAAIDAAGRLIDDHGGVAPIVNYALHRWITDYPNRLGGQVRAVTTSTPEYAIQGYGRGVIAVRAKHFHRLTPEQCFHACVRDVHDWHDLAHVLAAAASHGRFGVKYHDGLNRLPRYYRALTEGEGAGDATGPAFSDGMLFSWLSLPPLHHHRDRGLVWPAVQELVAGELTAYLSGRHGLRHPGTGTMITPARGIDPLELAVAFQNKRYERRAAEIETPLLIRGTSDGPRGNPDHDPLLPLSRSARLTRIADLDEPLYFEARNLCRHRTHEDALGRYAHHLYGRAPELAGAILDFYHLTDLRHDREINLYQLVAHVLGKAA